MSRRLRDLRSDDGVYAILYAVLVVVLLGMSAIVIDFAQVRQDRRLDRSAADSAALGGVALLDNSAAAGVQPRAACLRAWGYLEATLHITRPGTPCSSLPVDGSSCWTGGQPTPLYDSPDPKVGNLSIRIAWPIPTGADGGFLTSEIAPGSVSQPNNTAASPGPTNTDGYSNGCDKLGVAIFQSQGFGLAGAIGATGTNTQVHSVARVIPQQGPADDVAALNVLAENCETLVAKGGGKTGFVEVGPSLDDAGNPVSAGSIAVEASGLVGCNGGVGGGQTVIDVQGGDVVCAASKTGAFGAGVCDGGGVIRSHALDAGQGGLSKATNAGPPALAGTLTPEQGTQSWVPVTRHYGCETLTACQSPSPNFIDKLVQAYGGTNKPSSTYAASQAPYGSAALSLYSNNFTGPFVTPTVDISGNPIDLCPKPAGIKSTIVIPAGNIYVPCDLAISSGGTVVFQGGTVVVQGQLSIAGGGTPGCLVVNSAVATCPTTTSGSGARITSPVQPLADAQLFIQGKGCDKVKYCLDNAGTVVMPQTFVFNNGAAPINQASTSLTLWTPPAAGAIVAQGRTRLELACGATVSAPANDDCMHSRFSRLAYWSEDQSPSTNPNQFAGQGALNVLGVFFTPVAYFNFTGGGTYSGAAAQFWSGYLGVGGGASLGLSPFVSFSEPPHMPDLVLIR